MPKMVMAEIATGARLARPFRVKYGVVSLDVLIAMYTGTVQDQRL